jgi:hypothetical protein
MLTLAELLEVRGGALNEVQLWALAHTAAVALQGHLAISTDMLGPESVLVSPSAVQLGPTAGVISFSPVDDPEEVEM